MIMQSFELNYAYIIVTFTDEYAISMQFCSVSE